VRADGLEGSLRRGGGAVWSVCYLLRHCKGLEERCRGSWN